MVFVDRLLTLQDAASALSVSQDFLKKLYRAGRLPVVRMGRSVRISQAEVDRLVREGVPRDKA
jgi:excisionase family DNA binding protein